MAPILDTERLILRGHNIDDFEESASMWSDQTVVKHITGSPSSRSTSWTRLLRYAGLWDLLGFGYWVVEAKSDGRFIGEVGFADFKREMTPSIEGIPEAGWVLKSSEFGNGYATEAVARIHDWADAIPRFEKTVCIVDPSHLRSIAVARKVEYTNDTEATIENESALLLWRIRKPNK